MKKKEVNFASKLEELETKRRTIEAVQKVYLEVEDRMKWTAMDYHQPDDDHEDYWYTVPEPENEYDSYSINKLTQYEIYQEILAYLVDLV